MKRIYRKIFKSKKPSPGSKHGPGPVTATLTSTSTLMPSTPDTSDAAVRAEVTAGVSHSVSVHLRPSRL